MCGELEKRRGWQGGWPAARMWMTVGKQVRLDDVHTDSYIVGTGTEQWETLVARIRNIWCVEYNNSGQDKGGGR